MDKPELIMQVTSDPTYVTRMNRLQKIITECVPAEEYNVAEVALVLVTVAALALRDMSTNVITDEENFTKLIVGVLQQFTRTLNGESNELIH